MSKQKKSILLPGSFFEKDSLYKLEYLNLKNLHTVYVFDHTVNPVDSKLAMYEIKNAESSLQNYEERNFNKRRDLRAIKFFSLMCVYFSMYVSV